MDQTSSFCPSLGFGFDVGGSAAVCACAFRLRHSETSCPALRQNVQNLLALLLGSPAVFDVARRGDTGLVARVLAKFSEATPVARDPLPQSVSYNARAAQEVLV